MNLVIDDAVEVKQATKTTEESRRQLGEDFMCIYARRKLIWCRSNTVERRQRFVDSELERIEDIKRRYLRLDCGTLQTKSIMKVGGNRWRRSCC
jgi:hypothetical protein